MSTYHIEVRFMISGDMMICNELYIIVILIRTRWTCLKLEVYKNLCLMSYLLIVSWGSSTSNTWSARSEIATASYNMRWSWGIYSALAARVFVLCGISATPMHNSAFEKPCRFQERPAFQQISSRLWSNVKGSVAVVMTWSYHRSFCPRLEGPCWKRLINWLPSPQWTMGALDFYRQMHIKTPQDIQARMMRSFDPDDIDDPK